MFAANKIEEQSDALVCLLAAQCADLEKLLESARAQNAAIERGDFDAVFCASETRANLSERLEVFGRRVAELRANLGERAESVLQNPIAARAADLIAQILTHDNNARPLLVAVRETAAIEIAKLNQSQRCTSLYAQKSAKGLARDFTA